MSRWRNDNLHFTAELNRQGRFIWSDSHDRLRALASKAVDTLETSLDEGDFRVALEVLKAIGLYGQVPPPSGPEDADLVLWEEAREWAEMEFEKQRPSIDRLMAYTLGEIEIPALAQRAHGGATGAGRAVCMTLPLGAVSARGQEGAA